MIRLLALRCFNTFPVILVIAVIVFSLLYITPGDPALIIAGERATADEVAQLRVTLALDQPYLTRFFQWSGQVLSGNLGTSIYSQQPVIELIGAHLHPTLALVALTMLIAAAVAIPLGAWAAVRKNSYVDRLVMVASVAGFSVPLFVVGYLLAYLFGVRLDLLPVQGYAPIAEGFGTFLSHLILPSVTLAFVYAALIARTARAAMIEVLSQDFIRTAQAKGIHPMKIILVHGLRNAAIPILTVIGIGFAALIGGAVVTETVFSIPGLGRLTVDSILRRDYPVIQGVVLLFSGVYVAINLGIDILYIVVDPRVRL